MPSHAAFVPGSAFTPKVLSTSLAVRQLSRRALHTRARTAAPLRTRPHATATPAAKPGSATMPATARTSFRKYHGLGNDFILIDNRASPEPQLTPADAVALCDRHRGVGADGVIFLLPPRDPAAADCAMRLYNSDGSEPEMCGNGIRCLARFAADVGLAARAPGRLVVETLAGPIVPELCGDGADVRVDMGPPVLDPPAVPTTLDPAAAGAATAPMPVDGRDWPATPVSMGNPHAVIFVSADEQARLDADLETVGPRFESHPTFPQRTNTEFVVMHSRTDFDMLVWERGAGRTMACGTGACAVLVAAVLTGRADRDTPTTVRLPGGNLVIEWRSADNHVLMTGPAELVFEGTLAGM